MESAEKAILMLFGIPSKTHEPAKQLAHLIDHSEIPVGIRDDIDAGKMGYKLARQGYTLSVIDLLIAQLVIEKNLFLLTLDKHFKSVTKSFPLKLLPIPRTSLE